MRVTRQTGWAGLFTYCSAAVMAAGMLFVTAPAEAEFELPEGEKITNVPVVPRAIPQKEEYELYDPQIGKNFDLKKFWIRGDLRVRPVMRNGTCFGSAMAGVNSAGVPNGACNNPNTGVTPNGVAGKANDFYVQQLTRLGFGYDLSPDLNFYMELQDSRTWGGNGANGAGGLQDDTRNQNGCSTNNGGGNCGTLGVRAAYMLVRNFAGLQGLSVKAGRQYVVFGNQSLFGAFDWSNTGFSHDGVMLQYSTKALDSYAGWFRTSESDLGQAVPVGSLGPNIGPSTVNNGSGSQDSDIIIFYNQIKSVPGFIIEPYYFLYSNRYNSVDNRGQGLGTAKHSNQTRHNIGNRIEMRMGNLDASNETIYQFGAMGDNNDAALAVQGNQKNLSINAWATRNWIGYTHYQSAWKPRLAVSFDYASGDGGANCTFTGSTTPCKTANTFENMYPTNHIHMGYMDVQAWKNMMGPSVNFQFRPSKNDHIEIWASSLYLANTKDNWYRATQGVYVFSKANNDKRHIGDEVDFAWTHLFMDGKLSFQAVYGHMFAGGYIAENLGTSADQDWAYVQLWMNF